MFERHGYIDLPESLRQEIESEAKTYAAEIRTKLGVGMTEPIDVIPLLEQQGILVFQVVNLGTSGFVRIWGEDRAIFLNASEPLGRQFYTAAHEYAHILRHVHKIVELEGLSEEEQQVELKKMEQFANYFADHFLITYEAVEESFSKLNHSSSPPFTVSDVLQLQHYFKVSYRQMTRKLKKLGFLSEEQQNELNKVSSKEDPDRLVRETEQAGLATDLVLPLKKGRFPERYVQALIANIRAGRLTERKVLHLQEVLGLPELFQYVQEVGHGE